VAASNGGLYFVLGWIVDGIGLVIPVSEGLPE